MQSICAVRSWTGAENDVALLRWYLWNKYPISEGCELKSMVCLRRSRLEDSAHGYSILA